MRAAARLFALILAAAATANAQGGPPYYTNDPGTPGHLQWEINFGYMPFQYSGSSLTHMPDVDINFGVGERIQLTYENAWLRVQPQGLSSRSGVGQSNPGIKWRFYDAGEDGLSISVFPQFYLNNSADAVQKQITPPSESFLLPLEFAKSLGPVDLDYEFGYNFAHGGPNGWITGLVAGRDVTKELEMDLELYNTHTDAASAAGGATNQPTIGIGARYKIHSPIILLLMAGRSMQAASANQSSFVGYFGVQLLLPPSSYK